MLSFSSLLRASAFSGLLIIGVVTAASAQIPGLENDVPVFRVGDAVRLTVWGGAAIEPNFSGEFEIGEDGTVLHPLYRDITLAGLSIRQAESEFRRVLSVYETDPRLIVEPLFQIPVSGQVGAPSIYLLPPYATPAHALLLAGGPTPDADLQRARLVRDGRELVVDLRNPSNPFATTRIRSGDQIILDRRRSIWSDNIQPLLTNAGSIAALAYLILRLAEDR